MKTANNNTRSTGLPASIQTVEPKTIVAVVLVAAMLVLWGRVLMRSKVGPAAASAETLNRQVESDAAKSMVQIRAIALPIQAGRNDRIAADMFNVKEQWHAFNWNQTENTGQTTRNSGGNPDVSMERVISGLAKAITLDAVIQNAQGHPDKASVNGLLVSVGSFLTVTVGGEKYSLEIKAIQSKQVELTWQEHTIISKMPDYESGM